MRSKKLVYPFDYFAVELAGYLQGVDDTYPAYEFLPEAETIAMWLQDNSQQWTKQQIAEKIALTFSEYMEENYSAEQFLDASIFITSKLDLLMKSKENKQL